MTKRIAHIITGLNTGGAELVLKTLLSRINKKKFSANVISLTDVGSVGESIKKMNIPVFALGMQPNIPNPFTVIRLFAHLRFISPDVVQTWMYHSDFLGGLIAKLTLNLPVVWGIHHTSLDPKYDKRKTIKIAKICAKISKLIPDKIICCSEASRDVHIKYGYSKVKMKIIQNGVDTDQFCPNDKVGELVRKELGILPDSVIIGLIGRFHPQKGHRTFIEAAGKLHKLYPKVHFLLCGNGINWENSSLVNLIESAGVHDNCHLLGNRNDMPAIQASLDIASIASYGEAFPLVILEAMASGVPCVVTDVGDAAKIVGDTGFIVLPNNAEELSEALSRMVSLSVSDRRQLGEKARQRIKRNFELAVVVRRYEDIYKTVLRH